jgi:hypothetical protein
MQHNAGVGLFTRPSNNIIDGRMGSTIITVKKEKFVKPFKNSYVVKTTVSGRVENKHKGV